MQRIFVVSKNKVPLMPCSLPRAKILLSKGKKVVLKHYPFTILLKEKVQGRAQEIEGKKIGTYRYCTKIHQIDGYHYRTHVTIKGAAFPPRSKEREFHAVKT